jgi:hypothetical protein
MHDHWFDRFVKALIGRASRRGILRGAPAVALAAILPASRQPAASAHHGKVPLGGACRHTSQCLHHGPAGRRARRNPEAIYCAANGFHYDGPYSCCRFGGGSCNRDEDCCGSRHFCRGGTCRYLS